MSARSLQAALGRLERTVPSAAARARLVAVQRTRARLARLRADPAACAAMDACSDRLCDLIAEGRDDEPATDLQFAALTARVFEAAPWMGRATE